MQGQGSIPGEKVIEAQCGTACLPMGDCHNSSLSLDTISDGDSRHDQTVLRSLVLDGFALVSLMDDPCHFLVVIFVKVLLILSTNSLHNLK